MDLLHEGLSCLRKSRMLPIHAGGRAVHSVTVMAPTRATPMRMSCRLVLPFPASIPGRQRLRHSVPRSRSLRKKSSSSCISCSGLKSSSRGGRGASSPVVS